MVAALKKLTLATEKAAEQAVEQAKVAAKVAAEQAAKIDALTVANTKVIKEQEHNDGHFSKVSMELAGRVLAALGIGEGGVLALPASVWRRPAA